MIEPLPGYVLIEPVKEDSQSGGIYLPDDPNDKPCKGTVVSVPSKCPVLQGQTVVYKKWTNQEVKFENKDYLLVKFDELLAIIK
jgi:chaperonin GroES